MLLSLMVLPAVLLVLLSAGPQTGLAPMLLLLTMVLLSAGPHTEWTPMLMLLTSMVLPMVLLSAIMQHIAGRGRCCFQGHSW